MTFRDDYPPPAYAGYCWWADRRIFVAFPGRGTKSFEDTPSGLGALRIALLELSDNSRVVGAGSAASAARNVPVRRFDERGKEKVPVGDIFEEEGDGDEERGEIR